MKRLFDPASRLPEAWPSPRRLAASALSAAAASLALALPISGCGEGVLLGSDSSSAYTGEPVLLSLVYGGWDPTPNSTLSLNPISPSVTLPLNAPAVSYAGGELLTISSLSGATPVRYALTGANVGQFFRATFCFEVGNRDVSSFRAIRIIGMVDGGTSPAIASAPTGASFRLGVWNRAAHSFDANQVQGNGSLMSSFDIRIGSTRPSDAVIPVNSGGAGNCIFVVAISDGAQSASTPHSTVGVQRLGMYLE
jgi:hypothetical protein